MNWPRITLSLLPHYPCCLHVSTSDPSLLGWTASQHPHHEEWTGYDGELGESHSKVRRWCFHSVTFACFWAYVFQNTSFMLFVVVGHFHIFVTCCNIACYCQKIKVFLYCSNTIFVTFSQLLTELNVLLHTGRACLLISRLWLRRCMIFCVHLLILYPLCLRGRGERNPSSSSTQPRRMPSLSHCTSRGWTAL